MQSSKMFHFLSIGECIHLDLGMKNRGIPDSRITASSTLNANTPAMNGRLLYTAGSSWCAATNDNNPYLQIDLQSLHVICAVSTQGNSKADEWVETYTIQTSTDGVHWTEYGSLGHPKVIERVQFLIWSESYFIQIKNYMLYLVRDRRLRERILRQQYLNSTHFVRDRNEEQRGGSSGGSRSGLST